MILIWQLNFNAMLLFSKPTLLFSLNAITTHGSVSLSCTAGPTRLDPTVRLDKPETTEKLQGLSSTKNLFISSAEGR